MEEDERECAGPCRNGISSTRIIIIDAASQTHHNDVERGRGRMQNRASRRPDRRQTTDYSLSSPETRFCMVTRQRLAGWEIDLP